MKKLLLIVPVSIIAFVLVAAYFMYSASYPPRNPPPDVGMCWDSTDTQGFEDVYPKAENTGGPTFTLSKGNTGIAVVVAHVALSDVKLWNGSFRIDRWINVTFLLWVSFH